MAKAKKINVRKLLRRATEYDFEGDVDSIISFLESLKAEALEKCDVDK